MTPPSSPPPNALHPNSGTSVSANSAAFVGEIPSQLPQGRLTVKLCSPTNAFHVTQCFSSEASHCDRS